MYFYIFYIFYILMKSAVAYHCLIEEKVSVKNMCHIDLQEYIYIRGDMGQYIKQKSLS